MNPTLGNLRRLADRLGATIEPTPRGDEWSYNIDAPDGQRWVCNGIHAISLTYPKAESTPDPEMRRKLLGQKHHAIELAIHRMSRGLEACPSDCSCKERIPGRTEHAQAPKKGRAENMAAIAEASNGGKLVIWKNAEVITDRDLKPGTRLVSGYGKEEHICSVVEGEGGKITFRLDGKDYASPSAAGTAITGKNCNGWTFWRLVGDGAPAAKAEHKAKEHKTEAKPEHKVEEHKAEAKKPAEAKAKAKILRVPNQGGVPEGEVRWHCYDCGKSFTVPMGTIPGECPLEK